MLRSYTDQTGPPKGKGRRLRTEPTDSLVHRGGVPNNTSRGIMPLLQMFVILTLAFSFSQSATADTLAEKNPFLPPGYGAKKPEPPKPVVQTNGPLARELEFRGIAQFDGIYQFSVFNKAEQKAYWLREDQLEAGIKVSGYDAKAQSITVVKNGRTEKLSLMSATEAPIPVASSVTMPKTNNKQPAVPGLRPNNTQNNNGKTNTVPRRRVILPKK